MHRFPDFIVAAEAEGDVGDSAADAGSGQMLFDPSGGADEVDGVVRVFLDSGGDG